MKKITWAVIAATLILLNINIAFAGYSYYYPRYDKYNYPKYSYDTEEQYEIFPKYINYPDIKNKVSDSSSTYGSYTRDYQGQIIERKTKYKESLIIGKSGRVSKTISASSTEKLIGPLEYENQVFSNKNQYIQNYAYSPNNPSVYEGGSLWRYKESYDDNSRSYNKYYYQPRYDSNGYYNWRY